MYPKWSFPVNCNASALFRLYALWLSAYQQGCAEDEKEDYGSCHVAIVHDVLVHSPEGVQNSQSLRPYQHEQPAKCILVAGPTFILM
jgi:hypothetical protein